MFCWIENSNMKFTLLIMFCWIENSNMKGSDLQSRIITSFEMWCWRRMLRISWYMKRSNISVLEEIQPKRRLLSHVQSQMMKYFGHIARRGGNSLEKVIMQGCFEGRRKPGRPRTRWIYQIKSMVGCPLHELYNLVQDRQRWCDVVAIASCQSWQDRTDRPNMKTFTNSVGVV